MRYALAAVIKDTIYNIQYREENVVYYDIVPFIDDQSTRCLILIAGVRCNI